MLIVDLVFFFLLATSQFPEKPVTKRLSSCIHCGGQQFQIASRQTDNLTQKSEKNYPPIKHNPDLSCKLPL